MAHDPAHGGHGAPVFLINGFTKHDWKSAFFFAMAVAVGLNPEMLPMIVSAYASQRARSR